MAPKYECVGCGKRFVEWGAQKANFKCLACGGELQRKDYLAKKQISPLRPKKVEVLEEPDAGAFYPEEELLEIPADSEEFEE